MQVRTSSDIQYVRRLLAVSIRLLLVSSIPNVSVTRNTLKPRLCLALHVRYAKSKPQVLLCQICIVKMQYQILASKSLLLRLLAIDYDYW